MIELFVLSLLLHARALIGSVINAIRNSLQLSTLLDFFHTSPFLSFHFNLTKGFGKIHLYSLTVIVLLEVKFQQTYLADGLFFQVMVIRMAASIQELF